MSTTPLDTPLDSPLDSPPDTQYMSTYTRPATTSRFNNLTGNSPGPSSSSPTRGQTVRSPQPPVRSPQPPVRSPQPPVRSPQPPVRSPEKVSRSSLRSPQAQSQAQSQAQVQANAKPTAVKVGTEIIGLPINVPKNEGNWTTVHAYDKQQGIVSLQKKPGGKIIQFGTLKEPRFSNNDRVSSSALKLISNILRNVYDPKGIKWRKYFNFIKDDLFITYLQLSLFPSISTLMPERNNIEKLQWKKIESPIASIKLDVSVKADDDRELPFEDQEFYKYDKICDVLQNIVVTKSIPDKCFIRIRKWEVLIDERNVIKKISDCNKPKIGHTYYLYYSENTGLRSWNKECFKHFNLFDEGWFLDDIIPGLSTRNEISKISQLQKDTNITTHAEFITLLSTNNYVRQYTFFPPIKAQRYVISDTTVQGSKDYDYIEPKIYFTIDYSINTFTFKNSFFSFATTKCKPNFNYSNVYLEGEKLTSEYPKLQQLIKSTATFVKGGKNKRKVSKINKKDVLGKQRNVYKFVGDKKEYIKYKNKYVLLKKYKEMQKTKTKPKTKSKSKSKK
jgi:hypothetical protein